MRFSRAERDPRRTDAALQYLSRSLALCPNTCCAQTQKMSGMTGAPRDRRFTLVLLVVTILHAASADTATDRVSNFVKQYLKQNQIPGCAVTVRHDGKVLLCEDAFRCQPWGLVRRMC